MNEDIGRLSEEGYVVVRNVLSADEIARLRGTLDAHFDRRGIIYRYGETQPNAAAEVQDLEWIVTHPRIVELYRQVLGMDDIAFTAHCDMHRDMGFGWHKDDGQGRYMTGDYFNEPRGVVKLGIYLDDARDGSGMTLKPGSHRYPDLAQGEELTVLSAPGDLLFFDVRITHRGKLYDKVEENMLRVGRKLGDATGVSKAGLRLRGLYRRLVGAKPKRSLFFTYGADDAHTDLFAIANMRRQVSQNGGSNPALPDTLIASLARQRVRLCEVSV